MATELVSWALTELDYLKDFLSITVDDNNDVLRRLINQASSFIEKHTDRKLVARDYDSTVTAQREDTWIDGKGTQNIFTRQYPINSVSSVISSGATIAAAGGTDYYGSTGYIIYHRRGELYYANVWYAGKQNVRVSYNAGYATGTPELEDLRQLCEGLVSWVWNNRKHIGFKSERLGNYQYSRSDLKEKWQIEIITRYRRKISG